MNLRNTTWAQRDQYPWPRDRYEGDWELYDDNADQRPDLIAFLRGELHPPALIVLSGDVHHGFVMDALYAGAPTLDEIYRGKAAWAMRVVQVTSSPIKNIKKLFVDGKGGIDLAKWGQIRPTDQNEFKTMRDGGIIAQSSRAVDIGGGLGHRTFIYENHMSLVDFRSSSVDVLFVGDKRDSSDTSVFPFTWDVRRRLRPTVQTAATTVELDNDPAKFSPPAKWLQAKSPQPMMLY
jgi:hypothetical protein